MGASDHLANERTFLAWVRTGIASIGFGFVIAKFAIFISILKDQQSLSSSSVVYGEMMIIMGGVVIAYGLYNYIRTEKMLEKNIYTPALMPNVIFISIILALALVLGLLVI